MPGKSGQGDAGRRARAGSPPGLPRQRTRERALELREQEQATRDRQLEERERVREMFIAVLSHDLRTPIAAVRLTASLLLARASGALDQSALERIRRSADRMQAMVLQLLDFTRMRLGAGFEISRVPVDVGALLADLADELRAANPGRVIEHETRQVHAMLDRDRAWQAVSNLVRNALDHGSPDLPVRIVQREAEQAVAVDVVNGGPPIPEEVRETMFDPFRRGRGAGSSGLGLGLYIAREIAEAHGGSLTFDSSPRETRFTIVFPQLRCERVKAPSLAPRPCAPGSATPRRAPVDRTNGSPPTPRR